MILERDGPNSLTPPPEVPEWRRLIQHMFSSFNLLLWAASVLCLIVYIIELKTLQYPRQDNLYLAVALAVVVSVSGLFSYYQQSKSDNIMNAFKNMAPKSATVIRNGRKRLVPVAELVVGDLVELRCGDQIPADIRIIHASRLKVDNSSLTGESEPLTRLPDCTNRDPLETKNLVFYSTNCVEGCGKGIVIRTGDNTSMGRIANLASRVAENTTPLSNDIHRFISLITYVSLFFGLLFGSKSSFKWETFIVINHVFSKSFF